MLTYPHRRLNQLTGEWMLVSPDRAKRPWRGQVETPDTDTRPEFDPACFLCPGNTPPGGTPNPTDGSAFVIANAFPSLVPDLPGATETPLPELLVARPERGICRVVAFGPRHDLSLGRLSTAQIGAVVDAWAEQHRELGSIDWIHHVQIYENRGVMMGAGIPHPHGQIFACESIPGEPAKELSRQSEYALTHGRCLLCAYLETELAAAERLVIQNEHFVALVPFWAVWPFETLVLPTTHVGDIMTLLPMQRHALADILGRLAALYDRLFGVEFPYTMGFHQRPTDGRLHDHVHMHAHFYPPLLRSAKIRKFMAGFELLGEPKRDLSPESAAVRLREMAGLPGQRGAAGQSPASSIGLGLQSSEW